MMSQRTPNSRQYACDVDWQLSRAAASIEASSATLFFFFCNDEASAELLTPMETSCPCAKKVNAAPSEGKMWSKAVMLRLSVEEAKMSISATTVPTADWFVVNHLDKSVVHHRAVRVQLNILSSPWTGAFNRK